MANTGLIGRWRLNEPPGATVAPDSSGNNLHGRLGVLPGASGGLPSWNPGGGPSGAGALSFGPGPDGYVEVLLPRPSVLEPCVVSVEAWVSARPDRAASGLYILSKGANGISYASYALYTGRVRPAGELFYVGTVADNRDNGSPFVPFNTIWDGNWHHVVGTFDGRIVRNYFDGVEQGAGTPVRVGSFIQYNLPHHNNFYIGAYLLDTSPGPGIPRLGFIGDIADVCVWAGVLTPAEVAVRFSGRDLP